MYFSGIVASFLVLYAPFLFLFVGAFCTHPQLLLFSLFSALAAFPPFLLTSLLYVSLRSLSPPNAVYVLVYVTLTELTRASLLLALHHAVGAVGRGKRAPLLLLRSRFRLSPASAAIGVGFGAVSAWRGAGTLLDATWRLPLPTAGTAAYAMGVCPRLPLLAHATAQSGMLLAAHVAWAVMAGQSIAGLREMGVWPRRAAFVRCAPSDAEAMAQSEGEENPLVRSSEGTETPTEREHIANHTNAANGREGETASGEVRRAREVKEGEEEEEEEEVLEDASMRLTRLHETPWAVWSALIGVTLMHYAFSLVSLLNSGAFDYTTFTEVPRRGCIITLPFQATITLVSMVWSAGLLYNDYTPLNH